MLLTPGSAAVVLHSQEETIMPEVGTRDIATELGRARNARHTHCNERPASGYETGVVSGDSVNPHLRQARRRSSRRLYDRQAG